MGTPLRISEELVAEAKAVGDVLERSATSQIEHWARLGRAVEAILKLEHVVALKRAGATVDFQKAIEQASGAEGRKLALKHLNERSRPRYGSDPKRPGLVVQIAADGTKTYGHFVGRTFVPEREK